MDAESKSMLAEIWRAVQRIEARLDAGGGASASSKSSSRAKASSGDVAPDSDLDSQYGNPAVRKDPPRWSGGSFVGAKFSECPSDYLDTLAGFFEWKAGKDDAKGDEKSLKYAKYARLDARRARGWARRNDGEVKQPPVQKPGGMGSYSDDDVAF